MHFQEGSRKKLILSSRGKGLHNGACVKQTSSEEPKACSPIPKNAEFYLGDDQNLTSNTKSKYSEINNSDQKCEWKCKENYQLKEGKCKTIKKIDWEGNPFEWENNTIYIRDRAYQKPVSLNGEFRVGRCSDESCSQCNVNQTRKYSFTTVPKQPCIVRYNPNNSYDYYVESGYELNEGEQYFVICRNTTSRCSFDVTRKSGEQPYYKIAKMRNFKNLFEDRGSYRNGYRYVRRDRIPTIGWFD